MKACLIFLLIAVSIPASSQNFSFVFLNKKPDAEKISKEESSKIMEGHMANINRLASEGKLISAGPFEGGGGIFILNTTSIVEAGEWLSTDPGVKAKRWDIEILPYTPRIGSACTVKEPYDMVMYTFVRFISKTNLAAEILIKHQDYLKNIVGETMITEGIFGSTGDGILVTSTELKEEQLNEDPIVKDGGLSYQIKKLYIAKGAFCEK
jgi:uncharacterized protein YciI